MIFIGMAPIGGTIGRVADIALSFRTPGSNERTSQSFSLDYARPPAETPDEPYLSAPEMAERFAMYNMFLGLRAATQAYDPSCAVAVLRATRSAATAWNATHEDPDLAADLVLVDRYLANLGARGVPTDDRAAESCASPTPPYPDPELPVGPGRPIDDGTDRRIYECSAGGAAGGLPIALAALTVIRALGRRRRR
jgi:hypothetical protein